MKNPLRKLVFGLVFSLLFLAGLEVASRAAFWLVRGAASPWWETSPTVGWWRRPGFSGQAYGAARSFDDSGFLSVDSAQVEGDSAAVQILLLGDSTTFGYGVETESTFGEILDGRLPATAVINLGVPGFTSYQGRALLEELGDSLRPRIIVAAFNYNDRRYVTRPDHVDGAARFEWIHSRRLLGDLFLVKGIQYLARRLRRTISIDLMRPRVSPADFETNLRAIVRWSAERGASVIFLGMSDNPLHTLQLNRGIESLRRGDLDSAIRRLTPPAEREASVHSVIARKHLARALEGRGRIEQAGKVRQVEVFQTRHGGLPLFVDAVYSDIMKQVSSTEPHVHFIDVAVALNRRPECYFDHCHFDEWGHETVACLINQAITEHGLLGRVAPPSAR